MYTTTPLENHVVKTSLVTQNDFYEGQFKKINQGHSEHSLYNILYFRVFLLALRLAKENIANKRITLDFNDLFFFKVVNKMKDLAFFYSSVTMYLLY